MKEPQVLFNKVTNLIIRTFSSNALTTIEKHQFEKGIVTASVFKNVVSSDDKITCQEFLKLLVHLRIITPYPSTTPGDQELEVLHPMCPQPRPRVQGGRPAHRHLATLCEI